MKTQMVDLRDQYLKIKEEVDVSIQECIDSAAFINGSAVKEFQQNFDDYLKVKYAIPYANGTDALQIVMMAHGDEIICPAFTHVATTEGISLPVHTEFGQEVPDVIISEIKNYFN